MLSKFGCGPSASALTGPDATFSPRFLLQRFCRLPSSSSPRFWLLIPSKRPTTPNWIPPPEAWVRYASLQQSFFAMPRQGMCPLPLLVILLKKAASRDPRCSSTWSTWCFSLRATSTIWFAPCARSKIASDPPKNLVCMRWPSADFSRLPTPLRGCWASAAKA